MRSIAHCDRCRRWRYCKPVHFHNEVGQIFRHTWLCRPCSRLIGVRPAGATAHRRERVLSGGVFDQIAALAILSQTAIIANPDGTFTCIRTTPETAGEQP